MCVFLNLADAQAWVKANSDTLNSQNVSYPPVVEGGKREREVVSSSFSILPRKLNPAVNDKYVVPSDVGVYQSL